MSNTRPSNPADRQPPEEASRELHRNGGEGEVTALLVRMAGGDQEVVDALFALVYSELRRIARGQRRRETLAAADQRVQLWWCAVTFDFIE